MGIRILHVTELERKGCSLHAPAVTPPFDKYLLKGTHGDTGASEVLFKSQRGD